MQKPKAGRGGRPKKGVKAGRKAAAPLSPEEVAANRAKLIADAAADAAKRSAADEAERKKSVAVPRAKPATDKAAHDEISSAVAEWFSMKGCDRESTSVNAFCRRRSKLVSVSALKCYLVEGAGSRKVLLALGNSSKGRPPLVSKEDQAAIADTLASADLGNKVSTPSHSHPAGPARLWWLWLQCIPLHPHPHRPAPPRPAPSRESSPTPSHEGAALMRRSPTPLEPLPRSLAHRAFHARERSSLCSGWTHR